mgnify:CR=1 FL=1
MRHDVRALFFEYDIICLLLKQMKYKLKVSKRARVMRLEIRRDGELVVTVPWGLDVSLAERFVNEKSKWINDKLKYVDSIKDNPPSNDTARRGIFLKVNKRDYIKYKEQARLLAENRISHFNKLYNFNINRISIKNTKSRWGSCSKKGNLNFNYKIVLLPEKLADYVIVHELCHLKELNHSKNFWNLVSLALPDYKVLRSKLK